MTPDGSDGGTESTATRWTVVQAAGAGSVLGALAALCSSGAAATDPDAAGASAVAAPFDVDRSSEAVFPQSVASGGPTPDVDTDHQRPDRLRPGEVTDDD